MGRCYSEIISASDFLLWYQCNTDGLSWWLSGKESACWCRRCRFNPWERKIPRRRKWLPTSVFLPGKSQGQRSLEVYSPWDLKESDITEHAHTHIFCFDFNDLKFKIVCLSVVYFHPLFWVSDGPFKSEYTVLPILEKFSWIFCYFSPSCFLCSSSCNTCYLDVSLVKVFSFSYLFSSVFHLLTARFS